MNDLRSPMEDRPYRPADRQPSHLVRDDDVMSMTEYYRSRLEAIRQSRWFPLASVLAAVLVFSGVVSYAYKQGAQNGVNATTPIVEAAETAYKEKPADPGGMDVPFQDAIVFDQLQGKGQATGDTIESLLPPPEEPIATETVTADATQLTNKATTNQATTSNVAANTAEEATTETTNQTPQAPQTPVSEIPTVTAEKQTPEAKTAAKTTEQAIARKMDNVAPAAASPTQKITSGDYRIQLGAFRDQAAARAAWNTFQKQHAAQLSNVTPDFPRADLGAKGIFYRVQGKNLSKASADSICAALNAARSGSCLVTR